MRRWLLLLALALPLPGVTTLNYVQTYHGMVAPGQAYSVGGTGTITVHACTTVTVGDLICGNGGFGFHLNSLTAPTTMYLWFNGNSVNFVAAGTHALQMVVDSTGFSDTVVMSLVISPRTDPIITSPAGTFTGCASVNPAIYPGEQEICTVATGYPGHGLFTIPAQGSTYTDYNFGGTVRVLTPISSKRVIGNDATASAINLDNTKVITDSLVGNVYATDTTTGADTWDLSSIIGCGGACAPQSLNWSQAAAGTLYFFNWADNTIRSVSPSGSPPFTASAPLFQYRAGNQTFSAGISNGGEGVPNKFNYWGWATQNGTDHIVGITNLSASNPTAETYTADFSALASHTQVYTITGMSGAGVTPVHVTFTPALVPNSTYAVMNIRFDSGAVGETALNGAPCSLLSYVPSGGSGSFDCWGVTGNGTWTSGGTFKETCNSAGFAFPPCMRGVTMSKGKDITSGYMFVILEYDLGSGNPVAEIYQWKTGDAALTRVGHAGQYSFSSYRSVPTYTGTHCDDAAAVAGNCYGPVHWDTVQGGDGHQYIVHLQGGEQPYDLGFFRIDQPDQMFIAAENGGGFNHVMIPQSTGCAGFCGFHIGGSVFSPTAVFSTDEDPDITTWSITAATGNGVSPIHLTSSPAYSGANGDVLRVGGMAGETALNNGSCTVAALSGASFDCAATTGNGTWTSGGKFIQANVVPASSPHQGEVLLIDATDIATHQFRVSRLAKGRSWGIISDSTQSGYYSQPHYSISPDGTLVAGTTNFGYPEQFGVLSVQTGFAYVPPVTLWPGSLFGQVGLMGLGIFR